MAGLSKSDIRKIKEEVLSKVDETLDSINVADFFGKKKDDCCDCSCKKIIKWVLIVVGVLAVIAAVSYAVYSYMTPDYLEDFDDSDEEFDDDFFEDEGNE